MDRLERILELEILAKTFEWMTNEDEREAYPVLRILEEFIDDEKASTPRP